MTKKKWTQAEFRTFDQLTERVSGQNGHDRIMARLELRGFVDRVGKDVCDEMWAEIVQRDKLADATPQPNQ